MYPLWEIWKHNRGVAQRTALITKALASRERWSPHKPEWWNRLMVLWTDAARKPGYDKKEWNEFADSLYRATGYKP